MRARASGPRGPHEGVRGAAAWVIERSVQSLAPVDVYLESVAAPFDARDQALLRELVLGTLRWLRRIDAVIAQASHREFAEIEAGLRTPLRLAVYQLLFLDRVPAHAAVNEGVEQASRATHRGGASFANALLRRVARAPRLSAWPVRDADPVRKLAIEWSHPDFLVERWVARFGRHRAAALLEANNQQKPMHLLAFRDRGGRELLAERLIDEGIEVEASTIAPLGLVVRQGQALATAAFARGEFYIQDEASQIAALLPLPSAGERVLDAAAAPGGKTFSLLAWEPTLRCVVADSSAARLAVLRRNLARLGRRMPATVTSVQRPGLAAASFDRVLLDLPCSGTGTLRKHPEIKWRLSAAAIGDLADAALSALRAAADLVTVGGLLIHSTCSIEPEENEEVVERFLSADARFARSPLEGRIVRQHEAWIVGPGAWRLLPGGEHDGFSVQVLARRR
jgi:16S rRNA (cytosine967-C5)-methyltransferase